MALKVSRAPTCPLVVFRVKNERGKGAQGWVALADLSLCPRALSFSMVGNVLTNTNGPLLSKWA